MMDDQRKYLIPRYLDEPLRFILWTWDELVAFLLPLMVVYGISNQLLIGLVVGMILFFCLKKLKGNQGHYFVWALCYWYLPPIVIFKVTPPSYIRHYIG